MLRKTMIGIFVVAILGVITFSILDASQAPVTSPLADNAVPTQNAAPINAAVQQHGNAAPAQNLDVTAEPQQLQLATENVGDVWQASGTITALEDYGMTLSTDSGDVYVELGPPDYWQAQNVPLAVGSYVLVDGFINGDQIHARVVTLGMQQIVIRSESGQPLWAGGVNNAVAENQLAADGTVVQPGTGQTQFQVAPEDWVAITGTVTASTNGGLTLLTDAGENLTLQLGRPDFWQSQNITLAAGDPVEILGFWSGTQFMVGDITKTLTGEHIILRDPNGRQLWGGPGRNGASNGQSNGQGNSQGNGNGNGKAGSW